MRAAACLRAPRRPTTAAAPPTCSGQSSACELPARRSLGQLVRLFVYLLVCACVCPFRPPQICMHFRETFELWEVFSSTSSSFFLNIMKSSVVKSITCSWSDEHINLSNIVTSKADINEGHLRARSKVTQPGYWSLAQYCGVSCDLLKMFFFN